MKSKMRILILTPTAFPAITGNAITTERWRRSLLERGLTVKVLASQGLRSLSLLEEVHRFKPDLIHAHHAFRAGTLFLDPLVASGCEGLPLVVSPSGTDVNHDLEADARKESVLRVCRLARVIIAQGRETRERLARFLPDLTDRVLHVPKAVFWFGHKAYDPRRVAGCRPGDLLFFLPAGIRPVKGNLECLIAMERVYAARPGIRVVFAGPALDSNYTEQFEKEIRRQSKFARWIPAIPLEAMRSAYRASDVVLNTSFSEGLSNALLEAIAAGRPVLASNIAGNRWPVLGENGDQAVGYLFDPHDPEDFIRKALNLIDDERIRETFGHIGMKRAAHWPSPETEADGLIFAYKMALGHS